MGFDLSQFDKPIMPHLCSRLGYELHEVLMYNTTTGEVVYMAHGHNCFMEEYKPVWTAVLSDETELYVYCPDEYENPPTVRDLLLATAKVIHNEGRFEMRSIWQKSGLQ